MSIIVRTERESRFVGRRPFVVALVGVALLVLAPVALLGMWLFSGDSPREVADANLLPLPPGLALVGRAHQECPSGTEPIGECTLYAAVRGDKDPVTLLSDHLERRGWTVFRQLDEADITMSGHKDDLCVVALTPEQMEADVARSSDVAADSHVERRYGLEGGVRAALGQSLVFVTISYEGCR